MRKNNFNTNANGPSIEVLAFFDGDESRRLFDENIKILQQPGYMRICKAFYSQNGNVPDDSNIGFTITGTAPELRRFLKIEAGHYLENKEIARMKKAELIDTVIDYVHRDSRITLLNYEDLQEQFFKDYKIEITPSKRIEKIAIRRYSQGDYAEVFYCPDDLAEVWGVQPESAKLKEEFERLWYDSPVYARIDIDGKEYNYFEYVTDSYAWKRETFLQAVSKDSGVPVSELESLVPKELDYVG